ncbi:ABC transporter substrate-binding protein [Microlunatus sp. GCM10028923]|uniref:ABC transporter substrate-binding protein n=1 Tax=Microlunatus sp. GCM10028923 TaxID=3273400 RepID=UPI0036187C1B
MAPKMIMTRLGLAVALLPMTACGALLGTGAPPAGEPGARQPLIDGTFTMALSGDPGSLDPLHSVAPAAREAMSYSYESLLWTDKSGEPKPWLAEKWTATETEATFTLRDGVTCSDGAPFTASTAAANINYHADKKNASFYFGSMIQAGTKATADDAARTVAVRSAGPDPFLLVQTGLIQLVCDAGLKDPKSITTETNGTGAFRLTELAAEDRYVFERRPEWTWGPNGISATTAGLPKTVVLRIIPEESTAANLLLSGELTAAQVTGPDRARAEQAGLFSDGVKFPIGEFMFNEKPGRVMTDPLVRQALATAVDRAAVATVLSDGKGTTPTSLVTLDPLACASDQAPWKLPDYDLAAAGALLDEAGWKAGPDGQRTKDGKPLSVEFIYDEGRPTGPAAAELVADSWKQLGVRTELRSLNSAGWDEKLYKTHDWDAGFVLVGSGFPSFIANFFGGEPPPNGNNFMFVDNPDYNRLAKQAASASPEETCPLWVQAEVALVERFDVIPVVDLVEPVFANKAEFAFRGTLDPTSIRLYQ